MGLLRPDTCELGCSGSHVSSFVITRQARRKAKRGNEQARAMVDLLGPYADERGEVWLLETQHGNGPIFAGPSGEGPWARITL